MYVSGVQASTVGTVTSDIGINLRYSINGDIAVSIPYGAQVTIISTNEGSTVDVCNAWYKVSYGNYDSVYGCGDWIQVSYTGDVYNRPWTTPKKSIIGGAIFVGENYISKGQYNSYLKKFNVNPDSFYSTYNHQYQANLAAPSNEAIISYDSYSSNGLLGLPLNFVIPVYENMPDTTALPGKSADTSGQSNITDTAFENLLNQQGFPESYKKKLRALHNTYPNWTFQALHTNLDFSKSVTAEKAVSSISGNTAYYYINSAGNYVSTEPNWYEANVETVSYYLDPRNFLNVNGILQFESLKNSSNYTETVVQSILNNTFMSGNSGCDNQSYASIFVEAGNTADVSPVYLASLARQESGVDGSRATTGSKFTYKGVTYKWLYNFFNIGAYSSEEVPVLAGLVYASGGDASVITTADDTDTSVCPNTSSNDNNEENNEDGSSSSEDTKPVVNNMGSNYYVGLLGAKTNSNYLNGISVGTTVGTITNKLSSAKNVRVMNSSGTVLNSSSKIKTGDIISVTDLDGSTKYNYTVVIYGDVNGDGAITAADYVVIKNSILGKTTLSGAKKKAADINKNGTVTAADYVVIKNTILGKSSISQL